MKSKTAIYPGTFDPVTYGHLDIVERGLKLFDKVIIAVSTNIQKTPLFSIEERKRLVERTAGREKRVEVDTFDCLLIDYAKHKSAEVIIRGLRALADFEYEFQMALMNRKLNSEIETVYLMPREEYTYINSTIVKEVARFGGDVKSFIPNEVAQALKMKLNSQKL